MKISTEINSIAKHIGEREAIELCAKAGFDGWDFSLFQMGLHDGKMNTCIPTNHPLYGGNYLHFARELRKIGEDNGIRCNQSHAPFPLWCPEIRDRIPRAIECTAEAGGEICVIHPDNYKSPEENAEMYLRWLPLAKDCAVKIATENMWNWDDSTGYSSPASCSTTESFCKHLEVVNDEFFVACLDIGHAEMQGSGSGAVNMIRALGDKLQALHIHDNDRHYDSHQIPFSMDIDFYAVVKALKEIGYSGWLTLEADRYLQIYDASTVNVGVQKLADSAKKILQMFEHV